MGFFGLFGGSSTKSTEPPNRSERQKCYDARDAFFECLDRHGIVDSLRNSSAAEAKCGSQHKVFQRDCAATWVDYFKRQRVTEAKKKLIKEQMKNEGANELIAKAEPNR